MVRDMCETVSHNLYMAFGRSESASVSNAQNLCVKLNMAIKAQSM